MLLIHLASGKAKLRNEKENSPIIDPQAEGTTPLRSQEVLGSS